MFLPGFPLTFLVTIVYTLTSGALAKLIRVCDLTAFQTATGHFSGSSGGNLFARLFLDAPH